MATAIYGAFKKILNTEISLPCFLDLDSLDDVPEENCDFVSENSVDNKQDLFVDDMSEQLKVGKSKHQFGSSSTALQVLSGKDFSGKTAVITGCNTGIGFETARSLALHGFHVILACRNKKAATDAIKRIKTEKRNCNVEYMHIALEKLQSVKDFADCFNKKFSKLHILILNAGVFGMSHHLTEDGYEYVFQVNYLSHAYLALLLRESLSNAAPSRVIFLSSEAHRFSQLTPRTITEDFISPKTNKNYWSMKAYNNSKLLVVAFSTKLSQKWADKGIGVFSLHPGNLVWSDIGRHWWPYIALFVIFRPFTKSLQQAASTTVYCATSEDLDLKTGFYFNNCNQIQPCKASLDPEMADKIWNLSRDLIEKAGFNAEMFNK